MADVVYFDSGIDLPFCPPTIRGLYISGSGCCSDFYTAFIGGNQTYNLTYTLPTSSGTSGQVLTNDGNGNLSWQTFGGGVGYPGGNNGMIQYNDNGVFGGSTLLYWDDLNNRLGFNTTSPQQSVDIQGTLRLSGSVPVTPTNILGRDGSGDVTNISIGSGLSFSSGTLSVTGSTGGGSGTITGTGTTNYLSKWSSASGLTDSIIIQTGSNVDIRGTLRVTGSTGTANTLMGRDGNFDVSAITVGTGLSLSGNTISVTGSTGGVTGNYVPYIGATGNTNLGAYGIEGSYFQLNTATGGTLVPGMFSWNGTDGTADLMLKGGNVTLQIGQEQLVRVINETGANLLESQYKVVRVIGATANRLKVALALASGETTSAETIGIVTENISLNQEGFVTTSGLIRNINTTGSLQGETWADGDMLYLSPSTLGAITNIKPQAPNHIVILGYVVRAGNNGSIYVKVDNGYELNELHNVAISGQTNNDLLAYDSSLNLWKNRSFSSLSLTTGTGTTNYLPKWSSASGLTDSIIIQTGSNVDIRGTLRVTGSTGTGTTLMARDANFDVSAITVGTGLSLFGNTLTASGLTDGDKGDITVSNSGSVFTIDNNVVSDSKLRTSSGLSVIGRASNTTGNVADITASVDGTVLRMSGTTLLFGTVGTTGIADGAITNIKVASGIDATKIADGSVDNTEFQYLNNLTSNIQTQLNARVTGTGTTNYVTKWASATGITDSIIFDNGSAVGVNTASPQRTLDVRGTMRLTGSTGTGTTLMARDTNFDISAITVGNGLSLSNNILTTTGITAGTVTGTGTTNYLPRWSSASGLTDSIIFHTGTTVGINTATPLQTLHVAGTMRLTNSTATNATTVMGRDGNGDVSAVTVGSGLSLSGNTLTATGTSGGGGTLTGSGTATQVAFWGGATGTTSTALTSSSGLTWDNVNGRLGVGTSTPTATLQINGVGNNTSTATSFIIRNSASEVLKVLENGQITTIADYIVTPNFSNNTAVPLGTRALTVTQAVAIGYEAGVYRTAGLNSVFVGIQAGIQGSGANLVCLGGVSGGGNAAPLSTHYENGIYIGFGAKATDGASAAARTTNEIAIGYLSRGLGSNTTVIGNSGTTQTHLFGGLTVGSNTTLNASAILQADSTSRGFLPPRMSTTNKTSISNPTQGLVVYDTTMQALSVYNGTNWATAGGGEQMFTVSATTATVNFNSGNIADITLASSTTLTLTGGTFGTFILKLTQDAVGGRTVSWPSTVRWSGGIPPTLTTSPSKTDIISFIFDGSLYYGTYALNF